MFAVMCVNLSPGVPVPWCTMNQSHIVLGQLSPLRKSSKDKPGRSPSPNSWIPLVPDPMPELDSPLQLRVLWDRELGVVCLPTGRLSCSCETDQGTIAKGVHTNFGCVGPRISFWIRYWLKCLLEFLCRSYEHLDNVMKLNHPVSSNKWSFQGVSKMVGMPPWFSKSLWYVGWGGWSRHEWITKAHHKNVYG